jgi:hypothetical protein
VIITNYDTPLDKAFSTARAKESFCGRRVINIANLQPLRSSDTNFGSI